MEAFIIVMFVLALFKLSTVSDHLWEIRKLLENINCNLESIKEKADYER